MKKVFLIIIIGIFLVIYPYISFYYQDYLYMMSYAKNFEESEELKIIEQESCYDESYFYIKEKDITVTSLDYHSFLFFRWFKLKYIEGNLCETEFTLLPSYIDNFIANAKINEDSDNIDLEKLIKGKKPVVENKRYPWKEDRYYISYVLDNEFEEMFIYVEDDGSVIIQVGLGDEGPKYILYK